MSSRNAPSVDQGRKVAVFGAAGHTGRFVVAELSRRGFAPVAVGRDAVRLAEAGFPGGIETRVAGVEESASLDRALAGAAAVINCAGPFLDTAEALVGAAIRARIPYLDVSAEQASAQAVFDGFDAAAREAGVAVVPAMSFYGGLADLLATAAMGDWARADRIDVAIALDSWRPTAGTRITGQRNTAPRLRIDGGELAPRPDPAPEESWPFPAPFGPQAVVETPFSETVLIARHLRVEALRTWLNLAPLRDLRDAATPAPTPADESGRSAQIFLVEAVVRNGGAVRRATARGRDIYAVTAPLIVEAVRRILDGAAGMRGVLAPGEAFDARDFLDALAPEHLTLDLDG